MCGITGIFAFNLVGKFNKIHVTNATMALSKRGPDFQDIFLDEWVALGHRRLSIIDTTSVSNQPMWDETQRYCIVFNGEIFNYKALRQALISQGVTFFSEGDTEVLLKLFIQEKENALTKLNGFFSFCVYDKVEQSLFVARDRFGIKPLLYVADEDKFIFASEMKSILQYGIEKELDYDALYTYFQLNYIPAPATAFAQVKKLEPGHYIKIKRQQVETFCYYQIPYDRNEVARSSSYENAKETFTSLLELAVQRRLVSDVPLGAFLSGGLDSSVITALAVKHKPDLHTFSIGFRDEKFFDETHYANLVAKKLNTQHTVFSLTNDDLYKHVFDVLNYTDEPFADSSAIAVYILSKETRKHATVALSGDGADELLAGYNKHRAFYRTLAPGTSEKLIRSATPLLGLLPQSRNNFLTNKIRQFHRFGEGMRMSLADRYWRWAGYMTEEKAASLFTSDIREKITDTYHQRKQHLLRYLKGDAGMNEILLTDMGLVLPNDMLTKVDLMSMAGSLEVRVPFLDYEVVNFLFSLPSVFKINPSIRKRILQDTFRDILPPELYNRPKKGFEVPLLKWFRREMRSTIENELLSEDRIRTEGIFDYDQIAMLKKQLYFSNPGDVHATIWALIVFQSWYSKHVEGR